MSVSPGTAGRWKVALATLASTTRSSKLPCWATSRPPVCPRPSITSALGINGAAGKWSCRCSSASETFLMAVAERPLSNSVKRSIQNHRMQSFLARVSLGHAHLALHVAAHVLHGQQVAKILDYRVSAKRRQVGKRHPLFQLHHAFAGDPAVLHVLGVGPDIFGDQLAAEDFDIEGFLQAEDDVQKVDRLGPQISHQASLRSHLLLVPPQRIHKRRLYLRKHLVFRSHRRPPPSELF